MSGMANVFLKHLKFPKIFRLSLKNVNSAYFNAHLITLPRKLQNDRVFYTTAAAKQASSADYTKEAKTGHISSHMISNQVIDEALEQIDLNVRQSGRIFSKHITEMLHLISNAQEGSVTTVHGLYLIRACKHLYDIPPKDRSELANKIWNKFQEIGVEFNVKHYNALLDVHIQSGFNFNPGEILASMEEQQLNPNTDTYLCLLRKYSKDGNLNGAGEILEYIKEKGFSANEDMFNCLIEGHLNNGDFSGALDILQVMRSSNLVPNENTYTVLACGYAAEGEMNKMFSCLSEAEEKFLVPVENYLQVIKTLAVSGHFQYIDNVLSKIKNPNVYQQEFINAALELIHKDLIEVAYKLILESSDPLYNRGARIFIKQLVQSEKPLPLILEYCNDIMKKGICDDIILHDAAKKAVAWGKIDYALSLMEEMSKTGSLQRRNFVPLFAAMKENKSASPECIWIILKKMYELGIPVDYSLYLDYILPALGGISNPVDFIAKIEKSGQSVEVAADALFQYYCNLGEIDSALKLIKLFPVYVSPKFNIKSFVDQYDIWKRSASFSTNVYFRVLMYILKSGKGDRDSDAIRGMFLAEVILSESGAFEHLLRKVHDNIDDFNISDQELSICRRYLENCDPSKLLLFSKLRIKMSNLKRNMTFEEERKEIDHLLKQDLSCQYFLLDRIRYHITNKNVDRVEKLTAIFDQYGFKYSPILLSQLLTMYCYISDLPKVEEILQKLKENNPSFKLDVLRILDCSKLFIKYMKYEEAAEVLKMHLTKPYVLGNKNITRNGIRLFLSMVCDVGDVQLMKKIQGLLFPLSEVINSEKEFLDPLIHIHLRRDDLISACEEYEHVVKKYRIPICLNNLLKKCLVHDYKEVLQKVIDVTDKYIGKDVASVELLLALVETRHDSQTDKVIQNLVNQCDPKVLQDACMKLRSQNRILDLERLIKVTKPLVNIDREKLYCILLRAVGDINDYKKAIDIFQTLKEEITEPSNEAIQILTNIQKKKISSLFPVVFYHQKWHQILVRTWIMSHM